MNLQNIFKTSYVTGFSILFFYFDRMTKLWAQVTLSEGNILVFHDLVQFRLEYNSNLALSLPAPLWLQISISLIVLTILLVYMFKNHHVITRPERFFFAMILGGALGNLYDRAAFHQVVDFISIWRFPVFNVADILIFCGVCFLLYQEVFISRK